MNIVTLKNISKSYLNKVILNNIDFSIHSKDRIGIVGINGAGKSTLLKILAQKVIPDTGEVIVNNSIKSAYMRQLPEFSKGLTVIDAIFENLEKTDDLFIKAKKELNKFGINEYEIIDNLSGGEIKKIELILVMIQDVDLLFLDEPTNHLDFEMVENLQKMINTFKGAIVLITHDRYFLDETCNKIIEVDKTKLYSYDGNYTQYIALKNQRLISIEAEKRKDKSLLKKELAWMLRGARARSTKEKARIDRYNELVKKEYIEEDEILEITSIKTRLGKKTIELEDISKSYNDKKLFDKFSYIFLNGDRIGIIGKNGTGKSTFLKILQNIEVPDTGNVDIGQTVKIGYFSQLQEEMDNDIIAIDYIKEYGEYIETSDGRITATKLMEKFLFNSSTMYNKIEKLSGGEKRRLSLVKMLISSPNIIILDEPTNDLDINTLNILEDFLDTFSGIVICVSHDRYFLDRVVRRIFHFYDEKITIYEGGYTDFLNKFTPKVKEKVNLTKNDNLKNYKNREKKEKFTYKEQKDFENIDNEIEEIENKIKKLDSDMMENSSDFVKLNEINKIKEELENILAEKMDYWIYLQEKNERINNVE